MTPITHLAIHDVMRDVAIDLRVSRVLAEVVAGRACCIHPGEHADAKAMAVRVLMRLPAGGQVMPSDVDIDGYIAVFIALKTECVYSPMSHRLLTRMTGLKWRELKAREAYMLCAVGWRLYAGALMGEE